MAVYLDVIWALNFLFDCLLLSLSALVIKKQVRIWRVAAGGFIGSLIILLHFTPIGYYATHPLAKLATSILMVLATFGYRRFAFFISALLALYFSTFLIGGALMGAHYYFQTADGPASAFLASASSGLGDPVSWLFVIIGFPVAWHFSRNRVESIEMAKIKYEQLVTVDITMNEQSYRFTGMVDSGNQLYDPLSRLPVMFASIKNRKDEFPEVFERFAASPDELINGEKAIPEEWEGKLRIVPYSVVGQEHQLVVAVKPDQVSILANGQSYKTTKALVSFTFQQLSADGSFECIVHPKLLSGISDNGPGVAS
ncbi:sigma-E processing peptidase SpoIIGA [Bacillus sp. FJAT-27225]|uniref:sigma-E processing peptidase SpoIIGA n=1 Tax=Bacillus sp. FJAT-27225 TaxID=1743144 RepID=UPI00080C3498|nr:sigma-E processing peptidase SpoIIGA [Bacillus sp. FJAT-27225]OCA85527.1 sigma-E processing peptidase SpoIIGA [Bacillus sp. FJAT-27225]